MRFRVLAVAAALSVALAACGVKNDLVMPDGKPTAKNQKDPSKPPLPIGE
jgi:predicted small lipoprotein YifL